MKAICFSVLLAATVTQAADWPAWMGPQGCNISVETGLPESFDTDAGTNVKWATKLGTVLYGCPTVSKGRIFVGTNYPAVDDDDRFKKPRGGVVACLDEASGKILWKLVVPDRAGPVTRTNPSFFASSRSIFVPSRPSKLRSASVGTECSFTKRIQTSSPSGVGVVSRCACFSCPGPAWTRKPSSGFVPGWSNARCFSRATNRL
jgi:hypothetical protein